MHETKAVCTLVILGDGVRDGDGDRDGEGESDGDGVNVRDGTGVREGTGVVYESPEANCRNSPVRSRSILAITKNTVPANSMSRIRGRIRINPVLTPDDFRTIYL